MNSVVIVLISLVSLGEALDPGIGQSGGFRRPNQRLILPSAGTKADPAPGSTIDIFPWG
jgi:hypothetical protein